MSKQGTIRRYTLIIEMVKKQTFPTFQEIKDFLFSHGFELGDRTIERDIREIRIEFGIELLYNRSRNGYYIDYENSLNFESFIRFLEIVNTAEILSESLIESKKSLDYISFDSAGELTGIKNLKLLLTAIKSNREISFAHINFTTDITSEYSLRPYLLKEYQNRWYVIGEINNSAEIRTFGIERIQNLRVSTKIFKPKENLNLIEKFDQIIGLVYSENTIQEIVLSFTPKQGKYIKTLPLHPTQKVLIDNENECRVSLWLIPNYELNQQILKYGNTVKVIEPNWLITEIKNDLIATLKKYDQ